MIVTPDEVRSHERRSLALALVVLTCLLALSWVLSPSWILFWFILLPMLVWGAVELHTALTRRYRRRLELMKEPFPDDWREILTKRVAFYRALDEDGRDRFERKALIFLEETPIAGVDCFIDDETRLLVAASAVIPIFSFPRWEYGTLREVFVTRKSFDADMDERDGIEIPALGMVGCTGVWNGVMVLSQPDLRRGFIHSRDGQNVGIHEFAHLIDKATGHVDGVPASLPSESFRAWLRVVREEITKGREGGSDLDDYGFTSEEEFFAVASEYFFEAPDKMKARHPELYTLMTSVFKRDPMKPSIRRELKAMVRGK